MRSTPLANRLLSALLILSLCGCASTDDGPSSRSPSRATRPSAPSPFAESHFADVGEVELEYFQFGDGGTPLVFIQDHHDYFRLEEARGWVEFLSRFSDEYRVLAPVRRGWGQSEDPGHGYDIETQARDVLGLLDALDVDRAIFAGRTMATQEMLWIAENHPERVIALAFLNTPLLPAPAAGDYPELQRFSAMYARRSTDIGRGEEIDRRLQRGDWRPRFLTDPGARIDVPALLTQHPVLDADGASFTAFRIERLEEWSKEEQARWAVDPEAHEYVLALRRDPERMAELHRAVLAVATNPRTRDALERAFIEHLTIVWETPQDTGQDDFLDATYDLIRPYIDRLTATDGW